MRLRAPQPQVEPAGVVAGVLAGEYSDSVGMLYNVKPGAAELEYYFADAPGAPIGRIPLVVLPGEVTVVSLTPTPLETP